MQIELKVPSVGESITEVQIGDWLKAAGAWVNRDEPIVVIESDKATVEIPAPVSGRLARQLKKKGETARVGETVALVEENGADAAKATQTISPSAPLKEEATPKSVPEQPARIMPAARHAMDEHGLQPADLQATGPGGRLLKEDVLREVEARHKEIEAPGEISAPPLARSLESSREEEIVPMTPMRRRIAERLVEAQSTAALLTTFNEIDMSAVMALRKQHQESFQKKHGVKLGFMSFFVKAAIEALKLIPQVNAEIRGTDVVFRNYYDIGVAVGSGKGLVVPILRNAERLSFAEIEVAIGDFGKRAQESKINLDELKGGTFTISNGGVYGSLLSTPIVNPPQSGILGMHAIQERPVALNGQVVIRPMMYVALTYDHRIVDGREAVTFLKRIKECVEDPARMLLEI